MEENKPLWQDTIVGRIKKLEEEKEADAGDVATFVVMILGIILLVIGAPVAMEMRELEKNITKQFEGFKQWRVDTENLIADSRKERKKEKEKDLERIRNFMGEVDEKLKKAQKGTVRCGK